MKAVATPPAKETGLCQLCHTLVPALLYTSKSTSSLFTERLAVMVALKRTAAPRATVDGLAEALLKVKDSAAGVLVGVGDATTAARVGVG